MEILKDLRNREILKDITNEDKFNKLDGNEMVYIGFDPTAPSLHLGNYFQISMLKRFEKYGFKPLAVLGGATGMIGDPSGKSNERKLLTENILNDNTKLITNQLKSFGLTVFNNLNIYKDMSILSFLRNIGKNFNVNYMISKDVVSSRLEHGISFTEFSYQLIQGWDFKYLYENKNVCIQIGGSDQWGNITTGIETIRKTLGEDNKAIGITTNLLMTFDGKKFGKSEGNAIWLDKNQTSPFEIYQYLISTSDQDVIKFLNWLTFLSNDEINDIKLKHLENPSLRIAQKKLAFEIVKDIHGENEANNSLLITQILFGERSINELKVDEVLKLDGNVPTFKNIKGNILEVLVNINAASSKREAKEFVNSRAIEINGSIINDENFILKNDSFNGKANVIKRGKKKIFLIKY